MGQVLGESGRWYTPRPWPVRLLNRARILLTSPVRRGYAPYLAPRSRFGRARALWAGFCFNARHAAHPRDVELHAPLRRTRA